MKIVYIANVRMPTEKAHGVQIMKMCEAFSQAGAEIELVVPDRKTHITDDPFNYYGIKKSFKITRLWCLDLVKFGYIGFLIETFTFSLSVYFYTRNSINRNNSADVYYGRDELPLLFAPSPRYWEIHTAKFNFLVRATINKSAGIVAISSALKIYLQKHGVTKGIIVAHDGVDLAIFNTRIPIHEGRKIILYVGHLYKHKGVDTLAQAAKSLPNDVTVRFVGGTKEEIEKFRTRYYGIKNIEIVGHKAYNQIPKELAVADVLVLPNSDKDARASVYTSPMKLFEYMASGVPIVASDVPALREVLDESMAVFITPDDPQALATGVKKVLSDESYGQQLSSKARECVKAYTWLSRARKILDFISHSLIS